MAIFTEVLQSKDLLITSVLKSFYVVNSLKSGKFTAKNSSTQIFSIDLLSDFPKEVSLKILLLFGSIAADA